VCVTALRPVRGAHGAQGGRLRSVKDAPRPKVGDPIDLAQAPLRKLVLEADEERRRTGRVEERDTDAHGAQPPYLFNAGDGVGVSAPEGRTPRAVLVRRRLTCRAVLPACSSQARSSSWRCQRRHTCRCAPPQSDLDSTRGNHVACSQSADRVVCRSRPAWQRVSRPDRTGFFGYFGDIRDVQKSLQQSKQTFLAVPQIS
jgi:hypothetical protein